MIDNCERCGERHTEKVCRDPHMLWFNHDGGQGPFGKCRWVECMMCFDTEAEAYTEESARAIRALAGTVYVSDYGAAPRPACDCDADEVCDTCQGTYVLCEDVCIPKESPRYPPPTLPALRELSSAERKAAPVHAGVMRYFPDALLAVARVSKAGNDKHNPGEPLHWAREKSTDQLECIARHLLTPQAIDPETGQVHLAHAAWRALAALQEAEEKRLVAEGVVPMSGVVNG